MPTDALAQIQHLRSRLDALRAGTITPALFADDARAAQTLLDALPPRFAQVLNQLLNSLEAGAAFDEESCSFDQGQVQQNLGDWLAAAQVRLDASG